jgi:hypothetical protein
MKPAHNRVVVKKLRSVDPHARPIWDSLRLKSYLLLAVAAVIVIILLGFTLRNDLNASKPADGYSVQPVNGGFEAEADRLVASGACDTAVPLYVKAIGTLDYAQDSGRIQEVFKKYCLCQERLGGLTDGICTLKDPVKNITLAVKYSDLS